VQPLLQFLRLAFLLPGVTKDNSIQSTGNHFHIVVFSPQFIPLSIPTIYKAEFIPGTQATNGIGKLNLKQITTNPSNIFVEYTLRYFFLLISSIWFLIDPSQDFPQKLIQKLFGFLPSNVPSL